ncbi:hypothetical protein QFZ55_004386 [Streptomyces luteogriseus]|uniref:hypothetical protein n=1 Tax=Streptomyces luteogriseus TaxID=68233 RepID=UPI0027856811|nr:hypothetical protein [Streptomyces luteogriseus]MDQ0714934.1 hypothetical protein [Streptomyces luteogriseus]
MADRTEVTSMPAPLRRNRSRSQGTDTDTDTDTGSAYGTSEDPPAFETADGDLPMGDLAEVRIIAASPDIAQRVAQLLRRSLRCDEPRSYPAGPDGQGTLLHLTVDTGHVGEEPFAQSPWLATSHTQARRAHTDEPG